MKKTWTAKTGKKIELVTEVIGETTRDMIATIYRVTVDGKQYNGRPATYQNMACVAIVLPNLKNAYIPLPEDVKKEIDAEYEERRKNLIEIPRVDDPNEIEDEKFRAEFYSRHSDL